MIAEKMKQPVRGSWSAFVFWIGKNPPATEPHE